ncbi:MAG: pteridine reductase [Myxococcota bacterium]|jgi:pteridine reductase
MHALITGGGIRIGAAIATALAEAGFDLILHYSRSKQPAEALAERLTAMGRRVDLVQADLATPEGCRAVIEAAGAVDVLVNNAGIYAPVPAAEITVAQWDTMQAVNTRAPFLLAQGLLPGLKASTLPGGGLIVNIGDIGGVRPTPGYAHYSVSKAGLLMLTRALALELAPLVRVNAISPGTVLPPVDFTDEALSAIQQTIPAGRFGTAADIARTVVFLVRSPYITGQDIAVDGGRSIGGPMEAG